MNGKSTHRNSTAYFIPCICFKNEVPRRTITSLSLWNLQHLRNQKKRAKRDDQFKMLRSISALQKSSSTKRNATAPLCVSFSQQRLVSSTPWRPQGLNEVPEIPNHSRAEGFQYATRNTVHPMNAKNSEILHRMRQKIDEKWYHFDPVMMAVALFGCVCVYFLGRFVGNMQSRSTA